MEALLLHIDILWPAFLAGLLILSTHVPLGKEVLARGIIFLDLAIAQIAAFGIVLANTLWASTEHNIMLQTGIAIIAAVIGAISLSRLHTLAIKIQEACIGILFVLAATGSILLLAADPHGNERLKDILVGQILWIQPSELIVLAISYSIILLIWFKQRNTQAFYPLFAVTITLSTQVIGVFLVFASLIIPSLVTRKQPSLVNAYLIGAVGYSSGLVTSALLDLPTGATIVWCLSITALLYYFFNARPDQQVQNNSQ